VLWVALELPELPLQLAQRAGVSPVPLVISEGVSQRPIVACANRAAKEAGIRDGQAIAAAKALAGELRVVARDITAENDAVQRLAAWASQFTPMSCVDGQGIALEIGSTQRLFEGHAKLTAAIRRGLHELGFHATLGIAPAPLAARLFARAEAEGVQVRGCMELHEIRERVSGLPLFLMDWPQETLARLADLGVLRLRDILDLPSEGIARRFGPAIVESLDRLLGRLPDPREPYVPPPRFRSRLELPAEAEGIEALLFPLRRLLMEFEGSMRGRGAGVQRLTLVLGHGRKQRTYLTLDFSSPEREAEFILAIAREKLGRLTLPAPTIALDLRADALQPYVARESTWLPGAKEQALDRERLVERLSARLGADRVMGLSIGNDHRPEKGSEPFRPEKGTDPITSKKGSVPFKGEKGSDPLRPAFLLNRPQRLITEEGTPVLQGALELIAGPERIESGWWDGGEVSRDYFVASNPRGETFWIFREHHGAQSWYLHGVFA
jgi:protein ImuB